jgi:hypothetical protein
MVFQGSTSSNATSTAANVVGQIVSFSIANKTGGANTVKVAIVYGSTVVYLLYNYSLASGESYVYVGNEITLLANYRIYVEVSGSADYYFSIK